MIRSARSVALALARACALAFALTACGYLVLTAHRRANQSTEEATPGPASGSAPLDPALAGDSTFLPSSKVLVIDGSHALDADDLKPLLFGATSEDPTFLMGSKSAALPSDVLEMETRVLGGEREPSNSKGTATSPIGGAPFSALPMPGPAQAHTHSSDPSSRAVPTAGESAEAPTREPVFLPSSKAQALAPLRPQTSAQSKATTSKRVFLPSSKSLRIGEGPGVAPKPAPGTEPAPAEPPRNP